MSGTADTIASLATFPSYAAIGIIKISGSRAVSVVRKVFMPRVQKDLRIVRNFSLHYGWIVGAKRKKIDEVLVSVMRKPHSYTREDVLEIYSHGGPVVLHTILELLFAQGARQARPGEFTFRAFMNGRIDLTQAEAIRDIVEAPTQGALQSSVRQLQGGVSSRIQEFAGVLRQLHAQAEAVISFPEEDVGLNVAQMLAKIHSFQRTLQQVIEQQNETIFLREGIKCVICGRPNAGKSSLFNAFLRQERVIVSPVSGTTRDVIEERLYLDGIMLKLYDTAGIAQTTDRIHQRAVRQSQAIMQEADMLIVMCDGSRKVGIREVSLLDSLKGRNVIVVINKCDLRQHISTQQLKKRGFPVVTMSILHDKGLDALMRQMSTMVRRSFSGHGRESAVFNRRHIDVLKQMRAAVDEVSEYLRLRRIDIAAMKLKETESFCETILGRGLSEDVLDSIFGTFCIGK